jgi:hypothetical protein
MGILYDPQTSLVTDYRSYFYDNRDTMFTLPCVEGNVDLNGRWMLLNITLCQPLIKRHRPINRDKHLHLQGIYDASVHAKIETQISRTLEEVGYTREELGHDIITTVNDVHNLCYTHLGSHIRTMDIFSIADTVLQDDAIDILTMDYGDINDKNINRMETAFKERCKHVDDLLMGSSLDTNIFRAPLLCGALKRKQFHQFVFSAGPRSDTDDQMFLRPVRGSFLSGQMDIIDLAIESRAASKATHYNKSQMANTQYNNRKIHIQNSTLWHLYTGDKGNCGSTVYMTYAVPMKGYPNRDSDYAKHFVGKYLVNDDGSLSEIMRDDLDLIRGKTIRIRDVQGCLYTDGYCETCGGTITRSFSRKGNVGFLSNVNTGAPVAQQVLSTKHLTSTTSIEYQVPYDLNDLLMSINNDIYLRPAIRRKTSVLAFGFQQKDIDRINDLKYILTDISSGAYFSDIKYMYTGRLNDDGTITQHSSRTSMKGQSNSYPYLSPEVLAVIRDHPKDIVIQGKIAWLVLRNIDPERPVMQCTVVNDSIKAFVDQFRTLVTIDVERYRSMNDFMRDLTRLIWDKVDTHITHVSCLARACMITDRRNFHIPIMTDPDNVMFGILSRIIPMRSIGGQFAYQGVDVATNKSVTYITPKLSGIFDEFLGYQDSVDKLMHWPVSTGSAVEVESVD